MHQDIEFTHEALHGPRRGFYKSPQKSNTLLFLASAALFSMVSMTYLTQQAAAQQGETLGLFTELPFWKTQHVEPQVSTSSSNQVTVTPSPVYALTPGGHVEVVCPEGFMYARRTGKQSIMTYCSTIPPTISGIPRPTGIGVKHRPTVRPTRYPEPVEMDNESR